LEPFSSRVTFVAVGVAGSKNVTQLVATVFASPVRPAGMFESAPVAAAEADGDAAALADEAAAVGDAAADVVAAGGADDVELEELHAVSARQLAATATARTLRGRMFTRPGLPKK
jgi:hypothetical protein